MRLGKTIAAKLPKWINLTTSQSLLLINEETSRWRLLLWKEKKINIQRLFQMGDCFQHRSLTVLMTCFTYCWGTICDKSSLRKEEFVLAHSLRVQSIKTREGMDVGMWGCWSHSWVPEKEMNTDALLPFSLPQQRDGTAYISKWISCLLFISPQIQSQALSERCLLGDSKSSQADGQD